MSITKSNSYKTSDGSSFDTHASAKAHQDYLDRVKRLEAAFGVEAIPFTLEDIAKSADAFLAALNKPIVPRAKKVAA